ncbi:MAG: TRAP transporter fused permease subunit [Desulfobacterales bacterium]|jgi:TRAP transporter 4TM/12TM fusion protein|nr:TRAP transporter fused permease subunit [Desulfobacterales bacterium]
MLPEKGFTTRNVLFVGGLVFALFQLALPVFVHLIDMQLRALHVLLGISLSFLAYPAGKAPKPQRPSLWDGIVIAVVVVANVNIFLKAMDIYYQPGTAETLDLVLGAALFILVLEAGRRTMGIAAPIMLLSLVAYIYFAPWFPGVWQMRRLSWSFLVNSVYYSPLGIYGGVTGMSATFISMFVIFGALLSVTGAGRTFIDLALRLTGRFSGGPAKAAIVASSMFGSISGSAVANVMVTGNYTIPLMKKYGYEPEFAASVESISSTGGGVTPPIMSITAFMMAEFLNISYLRIIGYALIPCVLYYTGVFAGVHFRTRRLGLMALPEGEIPSWREILRFKKLSGFLVPTGTLLAMIFSGYPLMEAGFYASAAALVIYFVNHAREEGVKPMLIGIAQALSAGGLDIVRLVPILVCMSVLVNLIGVTGLAPKISAAVLEIGFNNIYLSLIIASLLPLLLGTALPVVPTYLLSMSILTPALLKLGVDEVAAHLFYIYWGVLGAITPPTCEAAVVAAGIAKGNWVKTANYAMRLGAVAFCLPYFMVLHPALVARDTPSEVAWAAGTGFVGAVTMAYGLFGRSPSRFNPVLRMLFFAGGTMMLFPGVTATLAGVALVAAALMLQRLLRPAAPASV